MKESARGGARHAQARLIAILLARRTTGSGRHAPGHHHRGARSRNGMFRLGLILGGSWCLRRQTGVTVETASTIEPGSAGSFDAATAHSRHFIASL